MCVIIIISYCYWTINEAVQTNLAIGNQVNTWTPGGRGT